MSERVLAIVVCYNPNITALNQSLLAVQEQGCDIVLIDNASTNISEIRPLAKQIASLSFIEQSTNLGLGAAHNIGIKEAMRGAYSHVLLLDQDSVPLANMVPRLLAASVNKSRTHAVSAVGATYLNADNGAESFFVRFGALKFKRQYCAARDEEGCVEADFLISSGSLVALPVLDDIGLMDEDLFIDHVDTEWFLRGRSKGYRAYGVCDAVMQHGLGEQTHRVSLLNGRQRNVPQHKPFRYYYIFRNSILLYKRRYASGLWKWNDVQRLSMIFIMFGLFRAPRKQNLQMMCQGVWDGLRGVTGALKS